MFTGEVDCTYFFTWDTEYACVKEKEDLLCSVSDGEKRYDLSALARHSGGSQSAGRSLASFPVNAFGDAVAIFFFNCQLIV